MKITILTLYVGQVLLIRKELSKELKYFEIGNNIQSNIICV